MWLVQALYKYGDFSGRARRKEYWGFILFNFIVGFWMGFLTGLTGNKVFAELMPLFNLAMFVPSLAVGVRRMQDTDHSGWWLLCPIYNLVLLCKPGDEGPNRFGPDPKDGERERVAAPGVDRAA